jgi:hypothetical protein
MMYCLFLPPTAKIAVWFSWYRAALALKTRKSRRFQLIFRLYSLLAGFKVGEKDSWHDKCLIFTEEFFYG